MKNEKEIYIGLFLLLTVPPIFVRLMVSAGQIALSEDLTALLTIISKVGLIIITIWYGLKAGIKGVWAWLLGFSTLLPLMTWVSLIALLRKKPGNAIISDNAK